MKMISKTAEYALRAIVYLAETYDEPSTTQRIAEAGKIPVGYLAKVMQSLSRAGIVKSQRGLNGGFALAKAPDEISILEVVNAVDPVQRIKECPLGLKAHERKLCPLHRELDDAAAHVEASFRKTFIADLVTESVLAGME
jgi:Rrf2 family protein